jgi:hypothetical protein
VLDDSADQDAVAELLTPPPWDLPAAHSNHHDPTTVIAA